MRPVIGIVPLYDEEKDSYWMLPGYMKALEECLSIPVMLPLTEDKTELLYFIRTCDGLLLPGGCGPCLLRGGAPARLWTHLSGKRPDGGHSAGCRRPAGQTGSGHLPRAAVF